MVVYSLESEPVWGMLLVESQELPVATLDVLNPDNSESAGLIAHTADDDRTAGVVQSIFGPMIISSCPILRSDDSGPIAGAVVMRQFLNPARLSRLRERTEVDMSWSPLESGAPPEMSPVFATTAAEIVAPNILANIHGHPFLELQTRTPRSISSLGSQTIRRSENWREQGDWKIPVSINLSAHQLRNRDLVSLIKGILKSEKIDKELINLELTETVLLEDLTIVQPVLDDLAAHGFGIHIDDFGTGYSSLSYLAQLPVQTIKIDQAFIGQLSESDVNSRVIEAIVALANAG